MRLRTIALGAILSAGACSQALGQAGAPQIPSVKPERQMDFGARINGYYDSNIVRGSDTLAAQRNIKPEDWVLTPSVTAAIVQPLGRQLLFLNGVVGYDFHRENPKLDRRNYNVAGGGVAMVGPCQQTLFGNYRVGQSDLIDLDTLTNTNTAKTTGVGFGMTCQRPIGPSVTALVTRQETLNTARLAKSADVTSKGMVLGVGYNHPTLGQLSFLYNYSHSEYPNRLIVGRAPGDSFFTNTYAVRYARKIGSRIDVAGGVGRTYVKREFAPVGVRQKFASTSYNGEATYRVGSRLTLTASGDRSIVPSIRPGKLVDRSTQGDISATYLIGSRYALTLGHSVADLKSNSDTALPTALVVTNSRMNSTYGSLSYKQSQRLKLTLDARQMDRKTNLPQFNYNATRVGLTADVSF